MQQFVTPDYLSLRIREKWEGIAPFATEILRYLRGINADGNREDSLCLEFRK